jgi:hypothetical protein
MLEVPPTLPEKPDEPAVVTPEEYRPPTRPERVEPLNGEVEVRYVSFLDKIVKVIVGNTGLVLIHRPEDHDSPGWTADFTPEGNYGQHTDRRTKHTLIFAYSLVKFADWAEHFRQWEEYALERPQLILGNPTNRSMYAFLEHLLGDHVRGFVSEEFYGEITPAINFDQLVTDEITMGQLRRLAAQCEKQGYTVNGSFGLAY